MAEPLGISAPILPTGGIDHRLPSGGSVAAVTPHGDGSHGAAPEDGPSTQLALGTTVEAVVRAAAPAATAGALPVGTQLLLRIVALPSAASDNLLIGRIVGSGNGETLVDTPLGLLALQERLGLAPDTLIGLVRLAQMAPNMLSAEPPTRSGGWPALDEVLAVLGQSAPQLAALLHAELAPQSGPALTGTLLFLLGALYQGEWPGATVMAALTASDHDKLTRRLADETEELRRLAADPATGEWRVLTLPLLGGAAILPLRLFLRRRQPDAAGHEATRFAIEVELSGIGPLQLDGLLRRTHLILAVRSHRSLPADLRAELGTVFARALGRWNLTGDLSFAAVAQFALMPLSNLRKHVQVNI